MFYFAIQPHSCFIKLFTALTKPDSSEAPLTLTCSNWCARHTWFSVGLEAKMDLLCFGLFAVLTRKASELKQTHRMCEHVDRNHLIPSWCSSVRSKYGCRFRAGKTELVENKHYFSIWGSLLASLFIFTTIFFPSACGQAGLPVCQSPLFGPSPTAHSELTLCHQTLCG